MKVTETPREKFLHRSIAALAVAGVAVSIYLAYLYFTKSESTFCSAGSGCDLVRDSKYASLLGIPVPLIGVFGYVAIGVVALLPAGLGNKRAWLFSLALSGFTFAAYLTYREAFTIQAWCPYCIVSAVVMTAITVLVLLQSPLVPGWSGGTVAFLGSALVVIVAVASVALPTGTSSPSPFATPTGPVFQTPGAMATPSGTTTLDYVTSLARHLANSGAVFYGAYWCSHCANQKRAFGDAAKYLPYVECDAGGPNAQPDRCLVAGVRVFPTWIIKGKRYEGEMSLSSLAELSGFQQ